MNRAPALPAGKLLQWTPMLVLQVYLLLTVLSFAFGPWPWPVYDPVKLYSFLAAAHVALLLGYATTVNEPASTGFSVPRMRVVFLWSLALNLLFILPTAHARTGAWIPDVASALADPGTAYVDSLDLRNAHTGFVEYLNVILAPILFLLIPWGFYYWRSWPRIIRLVLIAWLFLWFAIAIGMGTRKALADILIIAPWVFVAGHYSGHSRWTGLAKRMPFFLAGLGGYGFVQYFATGQITRVGGGAAAGSFGGLPILADFDHWTVAGLSPLMKVAVTQFILYVSQGYYALGLALDKPWVPMFGAGHSAFVFRNVARTFGVPQISELPYPVRVTASDGWDYQRLWDTIYPWIASDVSFPGTIVVMFFVGRLMARSWKDALGGENPLGVAVLALFLVLAFYIPANNQCCQDANGFTAFYALVLIWMFTRKVVLPRTA